MQKYDLITHTFLELLQFRQFLITYILSVSLKFWACYITGQSDEFAVKNGSIYLHILSSHFFVALITNFVFLSFLFLIWWSIEFPQQNINQWKTDIGDKKLSVELYVSIGVWKIWLIKDIFGWYIKIKNFPKYIWVRFTIRKEKLQELSCKIIASKF